MAEAPAIDLDFSQISRSLLKDEKLFSTIRDISASILKGTKAAQEAVEGTVFEAASTQARLSNVLTQVSLLANTRFVENRVFDEDDGSSAAASNGANSTSEPSLVTSAQVLSR